MSGGGGVSYWTEGQHIPGEDTSKSDFSGKQNPHQRKLEWIEVLPLGDQANWTEGRLRYTATKLEGSVR